MRVRLVAWNCGMALHRKFDALLRLRPDIAVVSECAEPERLRGRSLLNGSDADPVWVGDNPHKGLAVFSFNGYAARLAAPYFPTLRYIAPVHVTGPVACNLLAVWAQNWSAGITRKHQLGPLRRALAKYSGFLAGAPGVVAGDFNNNVFWHKPGWRMNHGIVVEKLARCGLVSAYHAACGEAQGSETVPTLYWRDRRKDGPTYHIDYVFIPAGWMARMREVRVGTFEEWCVAGMSDHAPVVVDVDVSPEGPAGKQPPVRKRALSSPPPICKSASRSPPCIGRWTDHNRAQQEASAMAATAKIFIDGEAGTTGLGIRERLSRVPGIELLSLTGEARKDPAARRERMAEADLVVLCLPDAAAKESVALAERLGNRAPKIVDASTAHRVASGWVYGFPEMEPGQADRIRAARKVANPGCYPTGAIALLRPLVDAELLPRDYPVTINAVSGYSGGGRSMIEAHDAAGGPAFELYGLGFDHKHLPETQQYARLTRRPILIPSVGHFRQGMLVSVPLHLDTLPAAPTAADLQAALAERYRGSDLVRVVTAQPSDRLEPEALNDSDVMELRVYTNAAHHQALLVARLDNLGKGASGAAVQSIRLMLGLGVHAAAKEPVHA